MSYEQIRQILDEELTSGSINQDQIQKALNRLEDECDMHPQQARMFLEDELENE